MSTIAHYTVEGYTHNGVPTRRKFIDEQEARQYYVDRLAALSSVKLYAWNEAGECKVIEQGDYST